MISILLSKNNRTFTTLHHTLQLLFKVLVIIIIKTIMGWENRNVTRQTIVNKRPPEQTGSQPIFIGSILLSRACTCHATIGLGIRLRIIEYDPGDEIRQFPCVASTITCHFKLETWN